jgi:hydrogenase maturation protease
LKKMKTSKTQKDKILVLGIGNILLGDEGVGVHAVREFEKLDLPDNVECMDGGTGGLILLEPMQNADHVIIIDATMDGAPAGTVRRLSPKFSKDYPVSLTAHDIGLKDLLDTFYLTDKIPRVTLFAVSIEPLKEGLSLDLSSEIEEKLDQIGALVLKEIQNNNGSVL